jgi:sugar phosphate isomerase/epimerase
MLDVSAVSRRVFLQTTAAASLLAGVATAEQPPPERKGGIKVGCLSWCFHSLAPGVDPTAAIDIIGGLGFDGIELIVTARKDIQDFWTEDRLARLSKQLSGHRLRVSQFVLFQPVVEGLASVAPLVREQNLDHFEAGCKIAQKLEASLINIVAPWPLELKGPTSYLPRYYEIERPKPGQTFHIDVAEGFDWERVWSAFVAAVKGCLQRARTHGLKMAIEHHTHTLIPETASFLRLCDAVGDPSLGYNLDAGWTQSQREYPPVAIHKVKGRLLNVHMRDIDGLMRRFVPFGEGVMDVKGIVTALKRIGFEGFVSLEQDKYPADMKEVVRRYLRTMRELIG